MFIAAALADWAGAWSCGEGEKQDQLGAGEVRLGFAFVLEQVTALPLLSQSIPGHFLEAAKPEAEALLESESK